MFQTKAIEEIKTYLMFNNFFFQKLCRLWNNVEFYGIARQVTDDNIMWHMHCSCWITKAADTHSDYVILIALPLQSWLHKCASMLLFYTQHTLPFLLMSGFTSQVTVLAKNYLL
jgi:hypothetical protein